MPKSKGMKDGKGDVTLGNQSVYPADLSRVENLLDEITILLRQPKARVEVGGDMRDTILIIGDGNTASLSKGDLGLFSKLQAQADPLRREEIYLTRFILDVTYARWEKLYLPLSGSLQFEPSMRLSDRADEGLSTAGVPLSDIRQALLEYQKTRFVILGEPGCGKTTTLNRFALDLARERLRDPIKGKIPVRADLFKFTGDQQPEDFLENLWKKTGLPHGYGEAISSQQVCFLLDGVNQMPSSDRAKRIDRWSHWATEDLLDGNWALFTCRVADYTSSIHLPEVRVNLLDEKQMRQYFEVRFGEKESGQHWREFEKRLRSGNDRFEKLARNPFMLNLMVDRILEGKTFGDSRAILMQDLAHRLIYRELQRGRQPETLTADPDGTRNTVIDALSRLAFAMQAKGEGTELTHKLAQKNPLSDRSGAKLPLDDILNLAVDATILEEEESIENNVSQSGYSFYHHLLQEYFAARRLLSLFRSGKNLSKYWSVPWLWWQLSPAPLRKGQALSNPPVTGWEETLSFAVALAGRDAQKMIETIAVKNLPLAGRCMVEVKGREDLSTLSDRLRGELLERQRNEHAHLRSRIDAGLALGELGHPDLRPQTFMFEGKNALAILPPMQEVPEGEFIFGSDPNDKNDYYDEKTTERSQTLPSFFIGRYAVTNAEFKLFIDAGGYQDDRWWTPEGAIWKQGGPDAHHSALQHWLDYRNQLKEKDIKQVSQNQSWTSATYRFWLEITQLDEEAAKEHGRKLLDRPFDRPGYWDDPTLSSPARPVVGINWHEANAYCAWLSAITGKAFRLPTEMEWEKAARGVDGRVYPWGDMFDSRKCNGLEGQIYRVTPIGLFPSGVSPNGIFDASGNVREWTDSWYKAYSGQEYQKRDYGEKYRIVRGGTWNTHHWTVRCASRGFLVPDGFYASIGFRLLSPCPTCSL